MSARIYPLPRALADAGRSFGLAYDVAGLLENRGHPRLTTADMAELRKVLVKFVYDVDVEPVVTVLDDVDRRSTFREIAGACLTCGHCFLPDEVPEDGVCGGCLLAAAIAERVELCTHVACPQPGTIETGNGLMCPNHARFVAGPARTLAEQYGYGAAASEQEPVEPERTDAEILTELRAVFGEPVEGRDFHVMPDREAAMAPARAEEDRISAELAATRMDEDQPLAARGHGQDEDSSCGCSDNEHGADYEAHYYDVLIDRPDIVAIREAAEVQALATDISTESTVPTSEEASS